jgi:hypothetical protein
MSGRSSHIQRQTGLALGRRDWLCGLAATYITYSLGSLVESSAASSEAPELEIWLRQGGADFLGDRTALSQLGAAYLQAYPEERSVRRLSSLLIDAQSSPLELRLLEALSRDWDTHNIVVVEGWVMARAEARVCAVLNLVNGGRA